MLCLAHKNKTLALVVCLIALYQINPSYSQTTNINNSSGGFILVSNVTYQKISDVVVSIYRTFFNFYLFELDIFIKFILPFVGILLLLLLTGVISNKKNKYNENSEEKVDFIQDEENEATNVYRAY